jgi:hypothetical protein
MFNHGESRFGHLDQMIKTSIKVRMNNLSLVKFRVIDQELASVANIKFTI